jgi:hypothetical protein
MCGDRQRAAAHDHVAAIGSRRDRGELGRHRAVDHLPPLLRRGQDPLALLGGAAQLGPDRHERDPERLHPLAEIRGCAHHGLVPRGPQPGGDRYDRLDLAARPHRGQQHSHSRSR